MLDYCCSDGICDMVLQPNGIGNVHPKQIGYNKMATGWLDSVVNTGVLPKCN